MVVISFIFDSRPETSSLEERRQPTTGITPSGTTHEKNPLEMGALFQGMIQDQHPYAQYLADLF